jgi:hypothetical protein
LTSSRFTCHLPAGILPNSEKSATRTPLVPPRVSAFVTRRDGAVSCCPLVGCGSAWGEVA